MAEQGRDTTWTVQAFTIHTELTLLYYVFTTDSLLAQIAGIDVDSSETLWMKKVTLQ
jgi:hypothetical protein